MTYATARYKAVRGLKDLRYAANRVLATKEYPSPDELQLALADLIVKASSSVKDAWDLVEQQRRDYERRLSEARAELEEQGANLRSMDFVDLCQAKTLGLISAKGADAEFARRRQPDELRRRALYMTGPSRRDTSDAVIAGYLPCGHPTCNRMVDAAKGYCAEHKPPEPQRFMAASGHAVDLDEILADQQRRI
jgi:hypothetical protein